MGHDDLHTPPLGLLLDVDGPIASPVTRTISIPEIADDLVTLANAGIPIVFNTGRSDAFLRERVLPALLERGVSAEARIVCVCEKGAVWFTVDYRGTSEPIVDESLAIPEPVARDLERMIRSDYDDLVFFDETKRAMVSAEQLVDLPSEDYLERQLVFDADALQIMTAAGLGVERRGIRYPNEEGRSTSASTRPSSRPTSSRTGSARTSAPSAPWSCSERPARSRSAGARSATPGATTRWPTGCSSTPTTSPTSTCGPQRACPRSPTRSSSSTEP